MNALSNLTKPQADLLKQFMNGRTFSTFNAHYANGGEYRFNDNGELVRYRTFWNLVDAVKKHEIDFDPQVCKGQRFNLSYEEARYQGLLPSNLEL